MFLIDRSANKAIALSKQTFSELQFRERNHLQEWIDKNPEILGETLLIISKEFNGFDDTNERLDLLALDTEGRLVVIENKLDDTGRDVTWQALKYVSYCSSLTKSDIRDIYQQYLDRNRSGEKAETNLVKFFDESDFEEVELNTGDQRIILVAASFRKEVTSTVMWLLDHALLIKCIKVTPYQLNDNVLISAEQILPSIDTEQMRIKYVIRKQQEYQAKEENAQRHNIRFKFWSEAIPRIQKLSDMYLNVHPSRENWISTGTGVGGVVYNCVVTQKSARVELLIGRPSAEENSRIFDALHSKRTIIEEHFGFTLEWDRLDDKIACRISYNLYEVNVFNELDWDAIIDFLGIHVRKLSLAISEPLQMVLKKNKAT